MFLDRIAFCGYYLSVVSAAFTSGPSEEQTAAPWGLARISHKSWEYSSNGNLQGEQEYAYFYHDDSNQVTVYMLDTGVDTTHPEFGGRAFWGKNFVTSQDVDDNGHGTHLAGIAIGKAHGVARNATLVSVKVLDSNREGTVEDFSSAVDWVISDFKTRGGKAVINYSAVGDISSYRQEAIDRAISSGIFFVNAAGNNAEEACDVGPANMGPNLSGFLAVAALNYTNTPATFTDYGQCIDVYAPGVDIESSLPNDEYGYMSGTSNAAAFVSGLVAYLWGQNSNISLSEMTELVRTANPNAVQNNIDDTTGSILYNYDA